MKTFDTHSQALTIVSNRLPFVVRKTDDRDWLLEESNGGLIKALDPILRQRGGHWLGWSGATGPLPQALLDQFQNRDQQCGYTVQAVELSEREIEGFYNGFSNGCIWPLFHNQLGQCSFNLDQWRDYTEINERFAQVLTQTEARKGFIWVHDYHLMLCGKALRDRGLTTPLAFFLHIPFPPVDTFMTLPWRCEIIEALMAFDLLGFQTDLDRDNFLDCAHQLIGTEQVTAKESLVTLHSSANPGGRTLVGTFPISVDFQSLSQQAETPAVSEFCQHLKNGLGGRKLLFGADRLDYSKGLLQRMKGYQRLLREHPELHNRISMVQYVVPGRESVPEYRQLHEDIERLVGEIDGEFTQPGWVPLHYIYRKLNTEQLLGYYRAADVTLVTSIKDGMNLVAKEYCAARTDEDGVLVLSEFAGAARELAGAALVVNPYDEKQLADNLFQACTLQRDERRRRMQRMRQTLHDWDIYHWVDAFLSATPRSAKTYWDWSPPTQSLPKKEAADVHSASGARALG